MIRQINTITGRTVLVLFVFMGILHVVSLWTYRSAIDDEIATNNSVQLAERLAAIRRSVMRVPVPEREAVAHALAGGPIDVHWSLMGHAVAGTDGVVPNLPDLKDRLVAVEPDLGGVNLVIGSSSQFAADPHVSIISMRLPDQSWVNVSIVDVRAGRLSSHGTLYSTTVMTVGLALAAVVLARWLNKPLRAFAGAANRFATGAEVVQIPERGPEELRQLAAAFNDMQVRIKKLIDDRTQTLAAISHDLRSPLTRLKLRLEELNAPEAREEMTADIEEMEVMIEGTLAFLKSDRLDEPIRSFDLVSMVEAVVLDYSDMGKKVGLTSPESLVVSGRRLALKRAVTNIIDNAIKYGEQAEVRLSNSDELATLVVTDRGPGIPVADREAVFAPFHRLEASRNKDTGGVGLGMTVSRSAVRAHGGEMSLGDGPEGGLAVRIDIPIRFGGRGRATGPCNNL